MTDYRRNRVPGGTYFLTINLADRQSRLLFEKIDNIRAAVSQVRRTRSFHIDAWVVLPEHMHCLLTLPEGDTDYSTRIRLIKTIFSKSIKSDESRSLSQTSKQERGIWQRRFWEHTIRDEADYGTHMDYIHFNPVRHGLATAAPDWPYSTFRRCVALGIYPLGWAEPSASKLDAGERQIR